MQKFAADLGPFYRRILRGSHRAGGAPPIFKKLAPSKPPRAPLYEASSSDRSGIRRENWVSLILHCFILSIWRRSQLVLLPVFCRFGVNHKSFLV